MSVLIKGMEMPTSCETCAFSRLSNTGESIYCCIDYDTVPWGDGLKSGNCPLVHVPPHGRLGDLDKLEDYFKAYKWDKAADIVCFAPTIIPAEEEET